MSNLDNSNNTINTNNTNTNTITNLELLDNDCCDDGFDSDSEEYQQFITNIDNQFMSFQNIYNDFCKATGREVNFMEMMSVMDVMKGGSGEFICIAGENEIEEKDRKYVKTMEEYRKEN